MKTIISTFLLHNISILSYVLFEIIKKHNFLLLIYKYMKTKLNDAANFFNKIQTI